MHSTTSQSAITATASKPCTEYSSTPTTPLCCPEERELRRCVERRVIGSLQTVYLGLLARLAREACDAGGAGAGGACCDAVVGLCIAITTEAWCARDD